MTLQIELGEVQEDILRIEAGRRGITIETYVRKILEGSLSTVGDEDGPSLDEEARLFDELAALGKHIPPSPDGETYSRKTIYSEHD